MIIKRRQLCQKRKTEQLEVAQKEQKTICDLLEQIVLRCINENIPFRKISKELGIGDTTIGKWVHAYEKDGINGLESKTGKCGSGNPYVALYNKKNLTEVERLKLELVKKEVECERLKKGYSVKGVGQRKEYVTISKKNSK